MKLYKQLLLLTFFINVLSAIDNYGNDKMPHYVWDSDSSNVGQTEIWFQDWTDYTRLIIKSINGSYSNVVGLPLFETAQLLEGLGYFL